MPDPAAFKAFAEPLGYPLDEWQLLVLDELYKGRHPEARMFTCTAAGRVQRAPASYIGDWIIVDEVVDWLDDGSKIDEARQRLIDEISAGVDAKIARLQCPSFPRAE